MENKSSQSMALASPAALPPSANAFSLFKKKRGGGLTVATKERTQIDVGKYWSINSKVVKCIALR